jgi:hypothetical protein
LSRQFDAHKNELSKDKDILRVVNVFIVRLDSIQQELINASSTSNEITTEIVIARSLVIKLCNKISMAIQHYAKENDFSMLKRNLYLDFYSLSDSELLDYAKQLLEQAESAGEILLSSELQNLELNSLRNLIDNLRQIVRVPGMMFKFRAKTSEAFDENIEENDKLLSELDILIEDFKHEEFNSEYLNLRNAVPA